MEKRRESEQDIEIKATNFASLRAKKKPESPKLPNGNFFYYVSLPHATAQDVHRRRVRKLARDKVGATANQISTVIFLSIAFFFHIAKKNFAPSDVLLCASRFCLFYNWLTIRRVNFHILSRQYGKKREAYDASNLLTQLSSLSLSSHHTAMILPFASAPFAHSLRSSSSHHQQKMKTTHNKNVVGDDKEMRWSRQRMMREKYAQMTQTKFVIF